MEQLAEKIKENFQKARKNTKISKYEREKRFGESRKSNIFSTEVSASEKQRKEMVGHYQRNNIRRFIEMNEQYESFSRAVLSKRPSHVHGDVLYLGCSTRVAVEQLKCG